MTRFYLTYLFVFLRNIYFQSFIFLYKMSSKLCCIFYKSKKYFLERKVTSRRVKQDRFCDSQNCIQANLGVPHEIPHEPSQLKRPDLKKCPKFQKLSSSKWSTELNFRICALIFTEDKAKKYCLNTLQTLMASGEPVPSPIPMFFLNKKKHFGEIGYHLL